MSTKRTHCPHGHAYTAENTYVYRGRQECKTCRRQRSRDEQRKLRHLAKLAMSSHDTNSSNSQKDTR